MLATFTVSFFGVGKRIMKSPASPAVLRAQLKGREASEFEAVMHVLHSSLAMTAALFAVVCSSAKAQEPQFDNAPAHIDFVDGSARVDRENQVEDVRVGSPFIPGDILRTDRGRVEV